MKRVPEENVIVQNFQSQGDERR